MSESMVRRYVEGCLNNCIKTLDFIADLTRSTPCYRDPAISKLVERLTDIARKEHISIKACQAYAPSVIKALLRLDCMSLKESLTFLVVHLVPRW